MSFEKNPEAIAAALVPAVESLMQAALIEATEQVIKTAVEDFEKKLRQKLAETTLNVASYYELERMGATLRILVKDVRS